MRKACGSLSSYPDKDVSVHSVLCPTLELVPSLKRFPAASSLPSCKECGFRCVTIFKLLCFFLDWLIRKLPNLNRSTQCRLSGVLAVRSQCCHVFTSTSSCSNCHSRPWGKHFVSVLCEREFVMNQKHFPVLHLLDIMNKSLSRRSKYLANVTSASKLSSLEYISQTLGFEPRTDTCIRILIICVLWQTV